MPAHVAPATGAASMGRHPVKAGATRRRSSATGTQLLAGASVGRSGVMAQTLGLPAHIQTASPPTNASWGLPYPKPPTATG